MTIEFHRVLVNYADQNEATQGIIRELFETYIWSWPPSVIILCKWNNAEGIWEFMPSFKENQLLLGQIGWLPIDEVWSNLPRR